MDYQVPSQVKVLKLNVPQKVSLKVFKPDEFEKLKNAIITMVFNGANIADFKMKINVYYGPTNSKLMFSSNPIQASSMVRDNFWFCELRFDFETKKLLSNTASGHLVELEVYDGYMASASQFLGLVYDFDGDYESIRGNYSINKLSYIPIRSSLFFEKG